MEENRILDHGIEGYNLNGIIWKGEPQFGFKAYFKEHVLHFILLCIVVPVFLAFVWLIALVAFEFNGGPIFPFMIEIGVLFLLILGPITSFFIIYQMLKRRLNLKFKIDFEKITVEHLNQAKKTEVAFSDIAKMFKEEISNNSKRIGIIHLVLKNNESSKTENNVMKLEYIEEVQEVFELIKERCLKKLWLVEVELKNHLSHTPKK